MSKHSPEEWTTSRKDMDSFAMNEEGKFEHVVYVYRGDQPRIPVFAGEKNNAGVDARLISASPDLLKAAKAIMDSPRGGHLPAIKVTHMMEAIAKAEEQP